MDLRGTILSQYVFEHKSGADYIRALEKAGISYRKTNMYEDFNRASACEWSRDYTHANRANNWFNFLTGYQAAEKKKTGVKPSLKDARAYFKKWQQATFDTTEEAEEAEDLADEYYIQPTK